MTNHEWQPIETAPKDDTDFLGYWPDQYDNRSWNIERTWFLDGVWHTPDDQIDDGAPFAPTHWMPLPEPPK